MEAIRPLDKESVLLTTSYRHPYSIRSRTQKAERLLFQEWKARILPHAGVDLSLKKPDGASDQSVFLSALSQKSLTYLLLICFVINARKENVYNYQYSDIKIASVLSSTDFFFPKNISKEIVFYFACLREFFRSAHRCWLSSAHTTKLISLGSHLAKNYRRFPALFLKSKHPSTTGGSPHYP